MTAAFGDDQRKLTRAGAPEPDESVRAGLRDRAHRRVGGREHPGEQDQRDGDDQQGRGTTHSGAA